MNYFLMMTSAESKRWDNQRSAGRFRYVLRKTVRYGVLPALILSAFAIWTSHVSKADPSFTKFVIILIFLFIPLDFLSSLAFWHFEEYRYMKRNQAIGAGKSFKD